MNLLPTGYQTSKFCDCCNYKVHNQIGLRNLSNCYQPAKTRYQIFFTGSVSIALQQIQSPSFCRKGLDFGLKAEKTENFFEDLGNIGSHRKYPVFATFPPFSDRLHPNLKRRNFPAMRNLKKILALVLALVMSLSLVTVANAAYSDAADIDPEYAEAVDVLTGLGVFRGTSKSANTFEPTKNITRAEVAAILYRINTGDVDDSEADLYTGYATKYFTDHIAKWAEPYVGYCANAEIYKGVGNKTFAPDRDITGYEVLATMLRALGYDKNGEFQGKDWSIQTAAKAKELGITDGITTAVLAQPAKRQLVAELLLRTMLCKEVVWNANKLDYDETANTLAYDIFQMEKVTGEVTGNGWADLTAPTAMTDGTTRLVDPNGKIYTVNAGTELIDIGKTMYTYVTPDKTTSVDYKYAPVTGKIYEKAGQNNMYDEGVEIDGVTSTIASAAKTKNMTVDAVTTQHFVNYNPGTTTTTTADAVLRYKIDLTEAVTRELISRINYSNWTALINGVYGLVTANKGTMTKDATTDHYIYEKEIYMNRALTGTDEDLIKVIFTAGNYTTVAIVGEVRAYTTTQTWDLSDWMKYTEFRDNYTTTTTTVDKVAVNPAGDRLIIIDNDKDGVADYVLQTQYCVGIVTAAKDGAATKLEAPAHTYNTPTTKIYKDVEADVLEASDVVTYAVIDGETHVQKADYRTTVVNTVSRLNETCTTADGETFAESGICEHSATLEHGVTGLATGVSYTLYLDRYGNLAAYTESADNGSLVLLTDGWYNAILSGTEYAVKAYVDGHIQTVNINTNGGLFVNGLATSQNSWGNLREIPGLNNDGHNTTTMLAYLKGNALTPVDQLYRYMKDQEMIEMVNNEIPTRTSTSAKGIVHNTTYTLWNAPYAYNDPDTVAYDVRGLSNTTYYVVYKNSLWDDVVVRTYVGYENLPLTVRNSTDIEDVYAVGTAATMANSTRYYTADAVVIEMASAWKMLDAEQVFVADFDEVSSNLLVENVQVIRADGSLDTVKIDLRGSKIRGYDPAKGYMGYSASGLYYMEESDNVAGTYVITPMDADAIAASQRYVVGYVNKDTATYRYDYTSIDSYVNNSYAVGAVSIDYLQETSVKNVADSKYYKLTGDYYNQYTTISSSTHDAVMTQTVNPGVTDRYNTADKLNEWAVDGYQRNEVLVAVNAKGEVLYAVSFNEYNDSAALIRDCAQYVWANNLPAGNVGSGAAAVQSAVSAAETAVATAETEKTAAAKTAAQAAIDAAQAALDAAVAAGTVTAAYAKQVQDAIDALQTKLDAVKVTDEPTDTRTMTLTNDTDVTMSFCIVVEEEDLEGENLKSFNEPGAYPISTKAVDVAITLQGQAKVLVAGVEADEDDSNATLGLYIYTATLPAGTDDVTVAIVAVDAPIEGEDDADKKEQSFQALVDELVPPADGDYENGLWHSPTLDRDLPIGEMLEALREYANANGGAVIALAAADTEPDTGLVTTVENVDYSFKTVDGHKILVVTYDIVVKKGGSVIYTDKGSTEKDLDADEPTPEDPTEKVEAAIAQADAALAADPQVKEDLEAAKQALTDAAALEGVTDEQKAALEEKAAAVDAAIAALDETDADKTAALEAYEKALAAAEAVLKDDTATSKEMTDAAAALDEALTAAEQYIEDEKEVTYAEGVIAQLKAKAAETAEDELVAIVQEMIDAKDELDKENKKGDKKDPDAIEAATERYVKALAAYYDRKTDFDDATDPKKGNDTVLAKKITDNVTKLNLAQDGDTKFWSSVAKAVAAAATLTSYYDLLNAQDCLYGNAEKDMDGVIDYELELYTAYQATVTNGDKYNDNPTTEDKEGAKAKVDAALELNGTALDLMTDVLDAYKEYEGAITEKEATSLKASTITAYKAYTDYFDSIKDDAKKEPTKYPNQVNLIKGINATTDNVWTEMETVIKGWMTDASASPATLDQKDGYSVYTKKTDTTGTLTVPAGVTVTQENYATYLNVTEGEDATVKVTVSADGKTITVVSSQKNKESTTQTVTVTNDTVSYKVTVGIGDNKEGEEGAKFKTILTGANKWELTIDETMKTFTWDLETDDETFVTVEATGASKLSGVKYTATDVEYTLDGVKATSITQADIGKTLVAKVTVKYGDNVVETLTYTFEIVTGDLKA